MTTNVLRIAPRAWYSWDFRAWADGAPVGATDVACLRESATLHLDDGRYEISRERAFSGAFVLVGQAGEVARAVKPSAFRSRFEVAWSGRRFRWERASAFGRRFVLYEGERAIGVLYTDHAFTRRAAAELPGELPLPVRLFLVWLAWVIWRRDTANG